MTVRIGTRLTTALAALALAGLAVPAGAQDVPDYYPDDYDQIIEASKAEDGLLIYSNMAQYNWAPVIEDFNKLYPWIEVSTLDLDSDEVFNRYLAEAKTGADTGDLLASATPEGWLNVLDGGNIMEYESPETAKVPEWSIPRPGVYTVSTDPMVLVWNDLVLPEELQPTGIADLAEKIQANPEVFEDSVSTYSVTKSSYGQAINAVYERAYPDTYWDMMKAIAPAVRPEVSSGPMLAKLQSGEYKTAYFISGIVLFPKLDNAASAQIMDWTFIEDGTPLFQRLMAVPTQSGSPNSAKLMLDFILSHDGQAAFGRGGLTPYRSGVTQDEVAFFTRDAIVEEVGEENLLLIGLDAQLVEEADAFREKWGDIFEGQ
ncbi:MAG TPA: substrate-binding domain-containing protein [Paracoccaceae bacterium]|nr:substrate-binding domain-containing protein [Paracoccaceae bacterium]